MMRRYITIFVSISLLFFTMGTLAGDTFAAFVPVSSVPAPLVVQNTSQNLTSVGCTPVPLAANQSYISTPENQEHPVITQENNGYVFFCDETQAAQLTIAQTPQIAGAQTSFVNEAQAQEGGYYSECGWTDLTCILGNLSKSIANMVLGLVMPMIRLVMGLWTGVGRFVIGQAVLMLGPVLSGGPFYTNAMVQVGWPFVLGIANVGFILALLFIAAATTLRIENFGIRRMLPRLFIGALFINFSALIATVVIDASRFLMYLMLRLMMPPGSTLESVNDIGAVVLGASRFVDMIHNLSGVNNTVFSYGNLGGLTGTNNYEVLATSAVELLLTWLFAGALIAILVQLFLRYAMLILLLIISPLAYLALAFPMADSLAKKWWQMFLKYVFFGPIVTFILLLLVVATRLSDRFPEPSSDNFFLGMISLTITATMLVAAALAGKQAGLIGAGATIGFLSAQGKKIGRATGTSIFKATGAQGLKNAGKDYVSRAGGSMRNRLREGVAGKTQPTSGRFKKTTNWVGKQLAGPKRKKDGTLEDGETSLGTWLNEKTVGRIDPKQQAKQLAQKRSAAGLPAPVVGHGPPTPANVAAVQGDATLAPEKLMDPAFVSGLSPDAVKSIDFHGSPDQKTALRAGVAGTTGEYNLGKEQIKAVVETENPQLIQTIVNKPNIVGNMSDDNILQVLQFARNNMTQGDGEKLALRLLDNFNKAKAKKE